MKREILLERFASQTRLAVQEDGKLCEIYYERRGNEKLAGNIYCGRVVNVLPGMNAAFVDIGLEKNAFLYAGDLFFDVRDQTALKEKLENRRIEKLLRAGQSILCQVVKEPGGTKGPRVSMNVTIPGRLTVLIPGLEYAGVSKKITGEHERARLREIANSISAASGNGIIIRTAGEKAQQSEIERDYASLCRIWEKISARGELAVKPGCLHSDGSLTLRCIRDLFDHTIDAVRTDSEEVCAELLSHADLYVPEAVSKIRYENTSMPLFDLLRVDHQLDSAFERRINLKSGADIVIDETEALTVIDVNSGRNTGKKLLSDTILKVNLEAAVEIARQLRLRDIGGIIIIDLSICPQKPTASFCWKALPKN